MENAEPKTLDTKQQQNSLPVCIRCRASLPSDREKQCAACDSRIADELRARKERDDEENSYTRLRDSGLPIDYRNRARLLGHIPMSAAEALTACQMLGDDIRGLYMHGPAGTYKTSIAAAYLASQIRGGASGRYVFVPDLMSDIHASYKADDGDSKSVLVNRCVDAPCLVLDDLGKEKASEHGAGVIFEILDGRYRNAGRGHWTIATSNYRLDSLCDRFPDAMGDPIRRRLSELTVSVSMERA